MEAASAHQTQWLGRPLSWLSSSFPFLLLPPDSSVAVGRNQASWASCLFEVYSETKGHVYRELQN